MAYRPGPWVNTSQVLSQDPRLKYFCYLAKLAKYEHAIYKEFCTSRVEVKYEAVGRGFYQDPGYI